MTALVFSPDGEFLLSGGYRSIGVRTASGNGPVRSIRCDLAQVHDLAFSPDGERLAVAGGAPGTSGAIRVLDWPSGAERLALQDATDLVTAVAFSPDGRQIAAASADRIVRVYPLQASGAGKPLDLPGHAGAVLAAAFSPEGRTLVTAGADRSLKAWKSESGELLHNFTNHTGVIHCIVFRPQREAAREPTCASGSDDRTVRVWQPRIGRMVRIVRQHEGPILAIAWSRDGSRLFSAGTEGVIRAIDGDSDRILRSLKAHDSWIYSLAISPDGRLLASGDAKGQIRLWDPVTGQPAAGVGAPG